MLSEKLTQRELEILQLLADGLSNQEIADHLFLSVLTVKHHLKNIFGKFGVRNRTQAVAFARQAGLLNGFTQQKSDPTQLNVARFSQSQSIKGYEILERVGAGGFGAVYRSYQPVLKRDVAIKVILPQYANQPEFIRRFEVEAEIIARLEHPHIVPIYDYWREPDRAYIVMRWLGEGSLHDALKQHKVWKRENTLQLVDQVTSALAAAHQKGIVHRDIKPANILLDEYGNAYLADFGIAKTLFDDSLEIEEDPDVIIGSPSYITPEQLRSEPVSPQTDLYSLGIVIYELFTGEHPFPDETPATLPFKHLTEPLPHIQAQHPGLPEGLDQVIQKATAKDPANRYPDASSLAAALHAALQDTTEDFEIMPRSLDSDEKTLLKFSTPTVFTELPTIIGKALPIPNPYKGLRAFQQSDSADFFGRETLVKQLLERLAVHDLSNRFLAVLGPSGSGKSSVVRAGLLPAIRRGALAASENWFVVEMFPGAYPFEELEEALLRVAMSPMPDLIDILEEDKYGLLRAVDTILPNDKAVELVLVIDQFEEVFTLIADETQRALFLESLLTAVTDPQSRLRVIVTMRADFYDRPLQYPRFGQLLLRQMTTVLPLSSEELEAVIVKPADRVGIQFEPGLATRIIQEVGNQPGTLPLLQYALTELFEQRQANLLTQPAYDEIGGVLGALTRRADELWQNLNTDDQQAARQLFLRLVSLGEGTEDTRRRVRRSEFTDDHGQLERIMTLYSNARLLTFDRDPVTREPTVEVAHEALIRQWARLREWISSNREDIRLHRRLTNEVMEWVESDRDAGFLPTGLRLEQYESWAASTDLALNANESAYIQNGIAQREAAKRREEARKAHEAVLQRRATNRLRYLVGTLVVFLVVAFSLSGFAFNQRDVAETARATSDANAEAAVQAMGLAQRQAEEANSLALASQSMLELSQYNTDLALFLGLEANRIDNPPAISQKTLLNAAYAPATRHRCELEQIQAAATEFNPTGTQLLVSTWDQLQPDSTLTLWNIETCQVIQQSTLSNSVVTAIVYMPDGSSALFTTLNTLTQTTGTVVYWNIEAWETIEEVPGLGYSFHISLSQDHRLALIDYIQAGTTIWEIDPLRQTEGRSFPYYLSSFLSDNQRAVAANQETAVLWDTVTGEEIRRFETPAEPLTVLSVSPDEKYLIGGTQFAVLTVWDMETGEILHELRGHGEEIIDLAFLPGGKQFLSASVDNSIRLWDIDSGIDIYRFDGHRDAVRDVMFLPENERFLSWSTDNTVRLWDLYHANQIRRFKGHEAGINALTVSPDGTLAASGDIGTGLMLWDVQSGERLHEFEGIQFVHRITFSPDGKYLLIAALNGLFLHDTQTYELVWTVPNGSFSDARFSPDGKTIIGSLLSDVSGGILFVDAETGTTLTGFNNTSPVYSGAFVNADEFVFSAGSRACLWSNITGQEIRCFDGHSAEVGYVQISPDGKLLLTASYDGTARLWNLATGDEVLRLEGHSAPIFSATFSKDGKTILTGSADSSFRVWDAEKGVEIRRINWTSPIWAAAFVPETQTILVGSEDGLVSLWDIALPDVDSLIEWIHNNRYVPVITCEQLSGYGLSDMCK